jgi:hypothetical protein
VVAMRLGMAQLAAGAGRRSGLIDADVAARQH